MTIFLLMFYFSAVTHYDEMTDYTQDFSTDSVRFKNLKNIQQHSFGPYLVLMHKLSVSRRPIAC